MKTKNSKLKDEVSTEIEQCNKEKIILKQLSDNHEIEYFVEFQNTKVWKNSKHIDIQLITDYEENQKKFPKILGKPLIRICDLEVKNDQKNLKVQLQGETFLRSVPYSYMKFHAPHQLVQFLLSIYNPYL